MPGSIRKNSAFLVIPQVERRHRLIEELRATAPRRTSGPSLAGRLGVSVRTIERDLAEAGVPICVQQGPGGGYLLEIGGPPVAIMFTAGEIAALVASLVAIGPYSSATAVSALQKLLEAWVASGEPEVFVRRRGTDRACVVTADDPPSRFGPTNTRPKVTGGRRPDAGLQVLARRTPRLGAGEWERVPQEGRRAPSSPSLIRRTG